MENENLAYRRQGSFVWLAGGHLRENDFGQRQIERMPGHKWFFERPAKATANVGSGAANHSARHGRLAWFNFGGFS